MADANAIDGFALAGATRPAGDLVAYGRPPAAQAVLRGRLADEAFRAAAEDALWAPLPEDPRMASAGPVYRLGPDMWLAISETDPDFGRKLEATDGLLALDASSTRARLRLGGPGARDVLATGVHIDLRPSRFPKGAFAQTPAGPATIIMHAVEEDAFDIFVARSLAQSWFAWLRHAGEPYGLIVAGAS